MFECFGMGAEGGAVFVFRVGGSVVGGVRCESDFKVVFGFSIELGVGR